MAASATLALKAGVWFRRGRRCMVSPDSQAIACPPSGRNSTYRPVQISGAGSKGKKGPAVVNALWRATNDLNKLGIDELYDRISEADSTSGLYRAFDITWLAAFALELQ